MSIDYTFPDVARKLHYDPIFQRTIICKVMTFRYLLGSTAILASFWLKGLPLLSWPWFPIVCLIFTVSNAAVHFLSRKDSALPRIYRLLPWFDVGFAPFFFAASGGFLSPFSLVLLFAATYNGCLFTHDKKLPFRSFGYLIASYLGIALLQKPGLLSWNSVWFAFSIGNEQFFYTITLLVVLFMVGGFLVLRHINSLNVRISQEHSRSFEEFLNRHQEASRRCAHARKMEAISRITRGITHDFNNSIAAISGYAAMLKKKLDGNEQCQSYIGHISDASKHAAEILERLSGNTKGALPHHPFPVNITDSIRAAVAKVVEGDGTGGVTIVPTLPPVTLMSPGDPLKFEAVIAALLQNALDACTDATGTVTVGAEITGIDKNDPLRHCFALTDESYIRVTVGDTGRGMSPEVLERIFEPFFTTKPKGGSTGMELANVWCYLIDFKGAIDVASSPDTGSKFLVYLPLLATGEPVAQVNLPPPDASSRTVLVVDDEASVREIYSEILHEKDYTVFTASNGAEAMSFLESGSRNVTLVLLDMMMPVMDGSTTFYALRKKYPNLKILFMSGCVDQEKMSTLLKEPGTAFFQKPCEDELLITLVESMISSTAT